MEDDDEDRGGDGREECWKEPTENDKVEEEEVDVSDNCGKRFSFDSSDEYPVNNIVSIAEIITQV